MATPPLNGCGQLDGSVGMHQLPPIATLTRTNLRIAQSKASAKLPVTKVESATLHVEGTNTVVELSPGGALVSQGGEDEEKASGVTGTSEKDSDGKKIPEDDGAPPKGKKSAGRGKGRKSAAQGKKVAAAAAAEASQSQEDEAKAPTADAKQEVPSKKRRGRKRASKGSPEAATGPKDQPADAPVEAEVPAAVSDSTTGTSSGDRDKRPIKHKRPKLDFSPSAASGAQKVEKKHPVPKLDPAVAVAMDGGKPPKWQMGDLLWAKVSGHPWWPCMVSEDPFTSAYTRLKGDVRARRSYHVQFFGDEAERGWINETSTLPFEGKINFFKHAENEIENATRSNRAKIKELYKVVPNRRAAWDIGVRDAEEALPYARQERLEKFTFVYEIPELMNPPPSKSAKGLPNGLKKRGRKRKKQTSTSDGAESDAPPKRVRKEKAESSGARSSRVKGGSDQRAFELFCAKSREAVLDEHPDFGEEAVVEYLQQQWSVLTDKQRAKYRTKSTTSASSPATPGASSSADPSSPNSESAKRSPRVSKPSLKKLEAEEDERRFCELVAQKSRRQILQGKTELPDSPGNMEGDDVALPSSALTPTSCSSSPLPSTSASSVGTSADGTSRDSVDEVINSVAAGAGHIPMPSRPDIELFRLNTGYMLKRELVCLKCEQGDGELLECTGPCFGSFHPKCLDLSSPSPATAQEFKCPECESGIHSCFSCKKADSETKKCSVSICGRFYHEECVKKYPATRLEGKGFFCPLHVCATCLTLDNKARKAFKGRLYRCLRCPVAYHIGDMCIAAGSETKGGFHIVCASHFEPQKNHSHHSHINVSWCFLCSKGGTLLCCETCPAAFHTDCLGIEPPEGAWYCSVCTRGPPPLYGDIIWVKLGFYRWWPGEICHPRNVPRNIQDMEHNVGEFPVHFFGSNDYFWMHRGRIFLFHEGDKGSREGENNRLVKTFRRGVNEATEAYLCWKATKENKELQEQEKNEKKPPPFKFVKGNHPVGSVQIKKVDVAQLPRCECKTDESGRACHSDTDCLNRMLMYECRGEHCPAGKACQNQRFQKRQYPNVEPFRTKGKGWGLKTLVDIKKGQFVHEYVGELIDEEECHRRIKQAHDDNITNFYMLTLDKNRIIDAGPKANLSRFMNHSCQPNCETQKWTVNGDVRVGLFAIHDIAAGSELTFNYNLECLGNEKTVCACGAPNCSGFLGVRPKAAVNEKAKDVKKKKKKKKKTEVVHEDECFRCGEGGELVMCDKFNCPKVYHVQCLNLRKAPQGGWTCPWHHCDVCGKKSKVLCDECPNSFCSKHIEGNIFSLNGLLVCHEHEDMLDGLELSQYAVRRDLAPTESSGESEASSETGSSNGLRNPDSQSCDLLPTHAEMPDADLPGMEESKPSLPASAPAAESSAGDRSPGSSAPVPEESGVVAAAPSPAAKVKGRRQKSCQEEKVGGTEATVEPETCPAQPNTEPAVSENLKNCGRNRKSKARGRSRAAPKKSADLSKPEVASVVDGDSKPVSEADKTDPESRVTEVVPDPVADSDQRNNDIKKEVDQEEELGDRNKPKAKRASRTNQKSQSKSELKSEPVAEPAAVSNEVDTKPKAKLTTKSVRKSAAGVSRAGSEHRADSSHVAPTDLPLVDDTTTGKGCPAASPESKTSTASQDLVSHAVAESESGEVPSAIVDGASSSTDTGKLPGSSAEVPNSPQVSQVPQKPVSQGPDVSKKVAAGRGSRTRTSRRQKEMEKVSVNGDAESAAEPEVKKPRERKTKAARKSTASPPQVPDGGGKPVRKRSKSAQKTPGAAPSINGLDLLADQISDDEALAVGPMFDDSEEEADSNLVIDIPSL